MHLKCSALLATNIPQTSLDMFSMPVSVKCLLSRSKHRMGFAQLLVLPLCLSLKNLNIAFELFYKQNGKIVLHKHTWLLPTHSQMSPLHQCIEMPMAYGSNYPITFCSLQRFLGQLQETVITPCMEALFITRGFCNWCFLHQCFFLCWDASENCRLSFLGNICFSLIFKAILSYDEFGPLLQKTCLNSHQAHCFHNDR